MCTYARVCVFVGLSGEPGQSVRCSNGGFKDKCCGEFPGCLLPTSQPFSPPSTPPKEKQTGTQAGTWVEKDRRSQTVRATARCSYSLSPSLAWAEPLQTLAACLPLCSFLSCGCCCCFDAYSGCFRQRRHHWFASFEQLLFVARYLLALLCISGCSVYAYSRLLCVCVCTFVTVIMKIW